MHHLGPTDSDIESIARKYKKEAKASEKKLDGHSVDQSSTPTSPRAKTGEIGWWDSILTWLSPWSWFKPLFERETTTVNTAALNQQVQTQAAKPTRLNNLVQDKMDSAMALQDIVKLSSENIALLNDQKSTLTQRKDPVLSLPKNLSEAQLQQLITNIGKLKNQGIEETFQEAIDKNKDDPFKQSVLINALNLLNAIDDTVKIHLELKKHVEFSDILNQSIKDKIISVQEDAKKKGETTTFYIDKTGILVQKAAEEAPKEKEDTINLSSQFIRDLYGINFYYIDPKGHQQPLVNAIEPEPEQLIKSFLEFLGYKTGENLSQEQIDRNPAAIQTLQNLSFTCNQWIFGATLDVLQEKNLQKSQEYPQQLNFVLPSGSTKIILSRNKDKDGFIINNIIEPNRMSPVKKFLTLDGNLISIDTNKSDFYGLSTLSLNADGTLKKVKSGSWDFTMVEVKKPEEETEKNPPNIRQINSAALDNALSNISKPH